MKREICRWFLHCSRIATTTREHPILGEVPICSTCNERVERGERAAERLGLKAPAEKEAKQ